MVVALALMALVTPAVSSTNTLGFLVPAYIYPSGAGNGFWEALNGTATKRGRPLGNCVNRQNVVCCSTHF